MPFKSKKQREYLRREKPDVWLKLKMGSMGVKLKARQYAKQKKK